MNLSDNFTKNEKKDLTPQLLQQVHDSVKPRWTNKFLIIRQLKNPPVYDSINASKSLTFMRGLLNSLGYYRDSLNFTSSIDTVGDQLRTKLNFNVVSVSLFRFDSINYDFKRDSVDQVINNPARDTLQQLTMNSLADATIKKGENFSSPALSNEINRLSDVYRNNGFLKFSSEELIVLWDTVGMDLLRPTLDPIEQARQLEQLRQRRANPRADVQIRLRSNADTGHLTRYFIGNVRIYPDFSADTALYYSATEKIDDFTFISYEDLFKNKKLTEYIKLKQGELYRQSNLLKTQNRFNSLPAWRLVTITAYPRMGTDSVDFDIKLTPARKYHISANLEGSRNQNPLVIGGTLLGLGTTLSIQNRNFARAANLAITNTRYGIELNADSKDPIQTQQFSVGHTVQIPRAIPNWFESFENRKTILNMNLSYTDRTEYYTVNTFNTSWGLEGNKKGKLYSLRYNIEVNGVDPKDKLLDLIATNASYKYIFNNGLILSLQGGLNWAGGKKNISNVKSLGIEISGVGPLNLVRNDFMDENLWRFIKLDGEFRQTHRIRRSAFAWRTLLGIGYEFGSTHYTNNLYMPFFRQYFGGGPNSMRAWQVRRLGPGSAIKSFDQTIAPDRFGDMRIELNAEYRFYMFDMNGILFNGALYTDIGNVWFLRKNPDFPNGEFKFSRLLTDLAVGLGTGLRVDFGFLKIRLEYAYKVKNPSPDISEADSQNKWFYKWELTSGQFQLGIDYPF